MIDLRPVGNITGWLVAGLGASMTLPMIADLVAGHGNAAAFATSSLLTIVCGMVTVLACAGSPARMGLQQSFLLATVVWAVFPFFGALPFTLGDPRATFTDAFFEAMSALTTTGSTVFVGLERLPPGTLVWRGLLQWFGGLGIVVVAMVFLPTLRIGGMQFFRSEAFDTMGKMLPRAGAIAMSLTLLYAGMTFICFTCYSMTGMVPLDALVNAMTTLGTGGMTNRDSSFADYSPAAHYIGVVFMILASLPFVRFLQFVAGDVGSIWRDPQVRGFLAAISGFVVLLLAWLAVTRPDAAFEATFREVVFNVVSILTGTGYASTNYEAWGPLAVTLFFVMGLIGGCSGSTTCSVKIFRYQLLLAAISVEIRRMNSPRRVVATRYDGRPVSPAVLDSVMAFFMMFFLTLAVVTILLVLIGLEPISAISGAASALANIGPGLGHEIGPAGNFSGLPDAAKWLLSITMLVGRLEVISVFVLFTSSFWRA